VQTGNLSQPSAFIPITLYQFDDIAFGISVKNDPATRDEPTDIDDRVGFDAVCSQRLNDRFELRHVEGQMLKADNLFATFSCIVLAESAGKSSSRTWPSFSMINSSGFPALNVRER